MFSVCLIHEAEEPEWYNQWSYVLSHWKPDCVYVIGEEINTAYISFRDAIQITDASELPVVPLVVLQPETGQEIKPTEVIYTFVHPESCVYMFGADHHNLTAYHLGNKVPDSIVSIPSDVEDLEMYSWVAGAITLYDRKVKRG